MVISFLKVLIIIIFLSLRGIASSKANLTNVAVARLVTFTFELVKIKSDIEVQNNHEIPAISYEFFIDPEVEIYHIDFHDKFGNALNYTKDPNNKHVFQVQFPEPLTHRERASIIVDQTHMDKLKSWYKTKQLKDENIMQYTGNVHYFSKYKTLAVATQYYAGKMSFLFENGYSLKPTSLTNNSISYIFAGVVPFTIQDLKINFLSNTNYYRVLNLERTIDISMYGMITYVDNIVLKNNGPKLLGPYEPNFHREDTLFTTNLPQGAHSIKYYDEIGMINSYELKPNQDHLSFEFKPRYPLQGGWKVSYSIKYLTPIYTHLLYSKQDGIFELNIPGFGQLLKNVFIEKATLKVLLPEGSSIINVNSDSKLIRKGNRKVFSGLSLNGRKQIEFEERNILDSHDMNVKIRFKQSKFHFIRAPLLISCHLFAVFLVVIFVARYKSFGAY